MTATIRRHRLTDRALASAAGRAREAPRPGAVRRGHVVPADAAREGAAQPVRARAASPSIDTSAAETMPGVVCVLTGADLADIDPYYGHAIKDRPIVAIDKVRFHGEPVAAVAAETPAAAAAGVERDRRRVRGAAGRRDTCEDALADGATLVTERVTQARALPRPRRARAARRERLLPLPDRPRRARSGLRARGHRRRGRVHVPGRLPVRDGDAHGRSPRSRATRSPLWATCQHPFLVRAEIADLFGVPVANVRIVVPYLGGGFGSKSYTKMEPLTVALARKAGRPVRIQNRVSESMVTTRRHNMCVPHAHGGDRRGPPARARRRVLVRHGRLRRQRPARRRRPAAMRRPARTAGRPTGSTRRASTRTPRPPGSYRAFGATHLQWIGESQVDEVARRGGPRPARGAPPEPAARPARRCASGGKPLDADLIGDVEKVAAAVGWDERRSRRSWAAASPSGCSPPARTRCRAPSADWRRTAASSSSSAPRRWGRGRARRSPRSPPRRSASSRTRSRCAAPTRASRRTTARPARAARRRIAGLAVQRAAADIRAQLDRDRSTRRTSTRPTTSR